MAKRRRLTPAHPNYLTAPSGLETKAWAAPPIAQVVGDASSAAALVELSAELTSARAEGRMVLRLPLEVVDLRYLERDRLSNHPEEMTELVESLRTHGQRTPIEVAEIGPDLYGLISGWRRITALARLYKETGDDRFNHVLALLRHPDTIGQAYIAMVEENEIRLGLSYYERARIITKALDRKIFPTEKAALQSLFSTASRAKRSKIGSFIPIVRKMAPSLRFPWAIPERLGLQLSKMIETESERTLIFLDALAESGPVKTPEEELAQLTLFLKRTAQSTALETVLAKIPKKSAPAPLQDEATQEVRPGVFLKVEGGWHKPVLTLSGVNVGPAFREKLETWLRGS